MLKARIAYSILFFVGLAMALPALPVPKTYEPPVASTILDTVWYFTNRSLIDDKWLDSRSPVQHGFFTISATPLRSDEVDFEVRLDIDVLGKTSHTLLEQQEALRSEVSKTGVALLHIHGFATSMNRALEEAAEMKVRGAFKGPIVIFAWPANQSGIVWPRSGNLLTTAYWEDSSSASASVSDLANVIEILSSTVGPENLAISAHSMGGQLLAGALSELSTREGTRSSKLRSIAFISPDVDREVFVNKVVPHSQAVSERTVLYGTSTDMMLQISSRVHDGRVRAGALGGDLQWPPGLEVVDITDGRTAATWLGPWVDTNHAIRRQASALFDLFSVVISRSSPICREKLGSSYSSATGIWKLSDDPLPPRPWMKSFIPTNVCSDELGS